MEDKILAQTILSGLKNNAGALEKSGIALDGRLIRELSQALFENATIKGLNPDLALALRRTTLDTVATQLGL